MREVAIHREEPPSNFSLLFRDEMGNSFLRITALWLGASFYLGGYLSSLVAEGMKGSELIEKISTVFCAGSLSLITFSALFYFYAQFRSEESGN